MDVPQVSLSVEDLLRPLAGEAEGLGERPEQFDDLSNMIVVLPILGAGLRVKEVVARDEFKNLVNQSQSMWPRVWTSERDDFVPSQPCSRHRY